MKPEEEIEVEEVVEEEKYLISNMAAASNAEHTQLQDMEEDVGMEERELDSEEDMGEDNLDDEEDDSSEDEKENEAEIQRLEEQVLWK